MAALEAQARRYFDFIHAHDFETLATLFADDAEYVGPAGGSKGRDEIVAHVKMVLDAFPDHTARIDEVILADGAVTLEWTEYGTHTQPFDGPRGTIPPTGKSFSARVVEVFHFEGDLISSQHEYYDLFGIWSQLGWLGALVGNT